MAGDGVEKIGQAVDDIGGYIRRQREGAEVSLRQLAKVAGISNPYLSQIERGLRKPSAEILAQIATGLRISAEALYVRAGILEPRESSPVLDAVAADPDLSERQKQVLHDIYESFRRGNAADDAGSDSGSDAGSAVAAAVETVVGPSAATEDDSTNDHRPRSGEDHAGHLPDQVRRP
ncbi:helix-turn-helix transcriptional regulator [Actinomycetospora lutea]|uniref:helix-turn-helix domain-containing protein n=1 Tax=Actinomycetospora lutea TaxID=663604 RepID=UPI002365074E|nr:helix-turn-helix transcriptional regulator [Actinomycetospora lutea]MDD7938106.1 helix-turn-helix transcriptional regulator [Actinomycetospora lutea]